MPNLQPIETVSTTLYERLDNRATKFAAGALFILGAVGLTACGSGAETNAAPKPAASHSAEATPTPTAETDEMPASLEQANSLPYGQDFLNLPETQRLQWCSWETRDMAEVAEGWISQSKNPVDKLYPLNGHNTPQELLNAAGYNVRAAWVSHQNATEVFDKDTALKVISCAFTNPNAYTAQKLISQLTNAYDDGEHHYGLTGAAYASRSNLLLNGEVTSASEPTIVNGNETVAIEGIFPPDGSGVATLTTIKGVDYNNQPTYFVTIDASY